MCSEVHFCNGVSDCSMVCRVYEEDGFRLVNVPNILLQMPKAIKVYSYICDGEEKYTELQRIFPVFPRSKPDDYSYTEVEIERYETLEGRISELEKNGGGGGTPNAVQFVPQELSAEQQEQARGNIGAASADDVSGKLDADKLPTAIESALAQAKESGEFDGEPGEPGTTPHIGSNGHWYIGSNDTGVKAQGEDGTPGITPHIGANGNWFIGETDTGVQAQGQKGDPGYTPQKGVDYFDGAKGDPGSDYNLTEADKTEIAEEAAALVDAALLNLIGEVE